MTQPTDRTGVDHPLDGPGLASQETPDPEQADHEVDESEQSSLEEPPEEEPSPSPQSRRAEPSDAGRPVFDAADNSPARQRGSDGDPSAPTEPVDLTGGGSGTFIVGG